MTNGQQTPPWYVLTGGPCSGKTTLITELKERGYSILPESARTVIAAGIADGKKIEDIVADPLDLEHSIIAHQLELAAGASKTDVLFVDRGIPDNIAYYQKFGLSLDATLSEAITAVQYRKVFLLEMIEFVGDGERYETPEEAEKLHEGMRKAYEGLGYHMVDVPVLPVPERADFLLSRLD